MSKKFFHVSLMALLLLGVGFLFFSEPSKTKGGALTDATDTLSNSRFSYRAGVNGTPGIGATAVNIDTSDDSNNNGDINTNHLFPNDTVCFTDVNINGCIGSTSYTVGSIVDADTFTVSPALTAALLTDGLVVATQSATHTLSFTLSSEVPSNGDILITIPAVDITGETDDGIPDTNGSIATNGFDLNGLSTSDVSIATSTSGTCNNAHWTVAAVTAGDASNDHTIRIDRATSNCQANSTVITVTIGTGSTLLINPAPIDGDTHTQGVSDPYTINVRTRGGSDELIDQVDMKVAPIESVLVSASVSSTLSFSISGVSSSSSACGVSTDVTTTATSVPWGTIAATETFYDAAHNLQVSTNGSGGYSVTATANDQLGKDGGTCTGDGAGEGDNCIPDTTCDNTSCSHLAAAVDDWITATNNGFGYSLESTDGTDATWEYDGSSGTCGSSTFCAAQFADAETGSQDPVEIMSNTGAVSSKNMNVCYRISISDTQPAGYYQNIVTYTASATF